MKTLANCKPSEFLTQTNKIRKSVANWLEVTDVLNIRQHKPEIPDGATEEEKKALYDRQVKANLMEMLDEILDKHPQETLEVLALCCFVEPDHVDDHTTAEYLKAIIELINDESVVSFFSFFTQLGSRSGRA